MSIRAHIYESLRRTAWDDIQFPIASGKVPAANYPDYDTFTTNTRQYKFAVDDYIDLEAEEMAHWWKEGTLVYPHIHVALDGANSAGAARYLKFTLYLAYADDNGDVYTEVSRNIEITVPDATADLSHLFGFATAVDFSGLTIGTQVVARIKRIAATAGTEYPNSVFITQVGLHAEIDGLGSSQIGSK